MTLTLFDQTAESKKTKPEYDAVFEKELKDLNPEQLKAVKDVEGPVLVLAGPGTGKTQTLAARIGHLLSHPDLQVNPHNILCLTFTEAATMAMRNRLIEFIGPTAHRVRIHTFHGFCNEIIQSNLDYFGQQEMQPIAPLEQCQHQTDR